MKTIKLVDFQKQLLAAKLAAEAEAKRNTPAALKYRRDVALSHLIQARRRHQAGAKAHLAELFEVNAKLKEATK